MINGPPNLSVRPQGPRLLTPRLNQRLVYSRNENLGGGAITLFAKRLPFGLYRLVVSRDGTDFAGLFSIPSVIGAKRLLAMPSGSVTFRRSSPTSLCANSGELLKDMSQRNFKNCHLDA